MLKFYFGSAGRRVAKILKYVDKDFTKSPAIQQDYKEMKTEDFKQSDFKLSDAFNQGAPKMVHLQMPAKEVANKYIKMGLKKAIDSGIEKQIEKLREEDHFEDQQLKTIENIILTDEAEKFRKIVFNKLERQRLLKKEDHRPENYLPENQLQNEKIYLDLKKRNEQFQGTLYELNNNRIKGMLEGQQQDPFIFLQKSQLLQQVPEAQKKIEEQIQLMSVENQLINNQDTQIFIDQIKQLVNENEQVIDWESLNKFYEGILQQKLGSTKLIEHQSKVQKVIEHQDYLFDKFYNNSLDHRVQGQLQFIHLTEDEIVRYIKYDMQSNEVTLKLIDTLDSTPEIFTPKIQSQLISKLSTFPFGDLQYLALAKDQRFNVLLNHIARATFNNEDLCKVIYSLTILRPNAILQVYEKLAPYLLENLMKQFLLNVKQIPTPYFAMALRNINYLPSTKGQDFKDLMTEEIERRSDENLSVYETESFIKYLSFIFERNQYLLLLKLVDKLFLPENCEKEFDMQTINILGNCLIKNIIKDMVQILDSILGNCLIKNINKDIISILEKNHLKLQPAILMSQLNHLGPFALMLAKQNVNRNNILVRYVKKRFTNLFSHKKYVQDEQDIINTIAAFANIDTNKLYYERCKMADAVILQSILPRQPFHYKSAYYLPYLKSLEVLIRQINNFEEQNIAILLQCLVTIQFSNSILDELVKNITNLNYIWPVYILKREIDENFEDLQYKFKQIEVTPYGALYYLQAMFHLNKLNKDCLWVVEASQLVENIHKFNNTQKCFLELIFSLFKSSHLYIDKLQIVVETLEQQYILHVAEQFKVDYHDFQLLLQQQQYLQDQRNDQLGIEKYKTFEIKQQAYDELKQAGYKVDKNKLLKFTICDLYIEEKNIALKFISISEMIKVGDQFQLTGMQSLIGRRQKLKYIIYEEYIRSADKLSYIISH